MATHLTKSLFKVGAECPTKLFYTAQPELYPSKKDGNEFLAALAEGGIQVGELAKHYIPGGIEIPWSKDKKTMLAQTKALLEQENVVIYEAAFEYHNFFVLVDILVKKGNQIELIEVKSKSGDGEEESLTQKKNPTYFNSGWKPYLLDVAFQTFVVKSAHPEWEIEPFLMVMDKTKQATVDGINQLFPIVKVKSDDGKERAKVKEVGGITPEKLGELLMIKMPVSAEVNSVFDGKYFNPEKTDPPESFGFKIWTTTLAQHLISKDRYKPQVGAKCKNCEFRFKPSELQPGQRSGFAECFKYALHLKDEDFEKPMVFDLNNNRKSGEQLGIKKWSIAQLETGKAFPAVAQVLNKKDKPWELAERQTLQIHSVREGLSNEEYLHPGLKNVIETWEFPLYFIDFEASRTAIPFHKKMRPYDLCAFQFSIHKAEADGTVTHHAEFLHLERGEFPNIHFIRALQKALEGAGTILTWSPYENTCLKTIREQLSGDIGAGLSDKEELISFIDSVIGNDEKGLVSRLVDMLDIEKKYYYHSRTGGSNSIKYVLPAILNSSDFLKSKYGKPDYNSSNYKNMQWVEFLPNADVKEPYALLKEISPAEFDDIDVEEVIANGGQAMMEWAKVQFMETSNQEVENIRRMLLRYCELDTLAMAMIWEGWREKQ